VADELKKGIPVDGATFEEARPVLRAVTESILLEIQKTFDFFSASAASDHINRIVVSGGASQVADFRELLEERFGTPVEEFDPFRTVSWNPRILGATSTDVAPSAAVAVGLALRRVGDR
jgi:type IV pilus assembly protein PilM